VMGDGLDYVGVGGGWAKFRKCRKFIRVELEELITHLKGHTCTKSAEAQTDDTDLTRMQVLSVHVERSV
jgi:hypothetical protein